MSLRRFRHSTTTAYFLAVVLNSTVHAQPGAPVTQSSASPKRQALIQEPVACRVYQRDSHDRAEIPIVIDSQAREASLVTAHLSGLPEGANCKFANGRLSDVPTGGPYDLIATLKVANVEQTVTVGPLFVGDLWVLAGQSNMVGYGDLIDVTLPHP